MTRRRRLAATAAITVGVLAGAGGLFEWTAHRMLRAPGAVRAPVHAPTPEGARALRVQVARPAGELDVWVLDPDGAPAATVVALHGLWDDKRSRVAFARRLTASGARAVLVDLRGHGGSTGEQIYFGAVEARDVEQVLDTLDARGLLVEPVGVHGSSYGGAVAHQLAGRDPRVRAVATVAAFADLEGLMRAYAELSWPTIGWALPDAGLRLLAGRAASHGGFDVAETDVVPAVRRSDARVLLFHGDADEVVPFAQASRIARACAPRGCRLVRLPGADHHGAMRDRGARRDALAFLRDTLMPGGDQGRPPPAR